MQDVNTANQLYDVSNGGQMLRQQYPPGLSTDRERSRSGSGTRAQAPPVAAPEPMQFQGQQTLQQPWPVKSAWQEAQQAAWPLETKRHVR